MAKFSVGRDEDDDNEGTSNPRPKRQKGNFSSLEATQERQARKHKLDLEEAVASDCEEEEDEEEEGEGGEEGEAESENAEEDGEEELGEERDDGQYDAERWNAERPSDDTYGSISVTLTDPDVLDCPVCLEPLTAPVYQCENGHVACSSCCGMLKNKCPPCALPIGYNRCRAIEKVIESIKISCRYMKYGCRERVNYPKKHEHEETCIYAPCSCPLPDCNFIGSSKTLFAHFSRKHPTSAKRFRYNCHIPITITPQQKYLLLQERSEGRLFILYKGTELIGYTLHVSCIGPTSSSKGFAYHLVAGSGFPSVSLRAHTECSLGLVAGDPPLNKKFLLVPPDLLASPGLLNLNLYISNIL
ncbi:E3 ubiquitin-protein ligase SINA-like 10 [Diospyros lotus]|uniref:E3 ubiquitin-protein ligase SINA-like 10 n=1 Tax=Diospyros lotus TaxID=55363 RepID=UPI002258F611|nr:E3 ubiquitin-protein ligase SINA-like 10 [Diospyros lotus]